MVIYDGMQRWPEALARADKLLELRPDLPDARVGVGILYARAGDLEKARSLLQQGKGADPGITAMGYAVLGDIDRAFEWLERGVDAKSQDLNNIKTNHWFDDLRSDPRYDALLERMGLL